MTRPAVSYDELDEYLRGDGHNDYVGVSAIDGLIAAVVAGPVKIPAHTWLPHVFGGSIPQTRPGSIEERLVNTVLNRHDEVESLLRDAPGHYFPIFMNHKGETIVGPWAIGFSLGLSLGGEAWAASRHESGESVRHLRTYGDHAARKEVSRRSGLRSGLSVGVQM